MPDRYSVPFNVLQQVLIECVRDRVVILGLTYDNTTATIVPAENSEVAFVTVLQRNGVLPLPNDVSFNAGSVVTITSSLLQLGYGVRVFGAMIPGYWYETTPVADTSSLVEVFGGVTRTIPPDRPVVGPPPRSLLRGDQVFQ